MQLLFPVLFILFVDLHFFLILFTLSMKYLNFIFVVWVYLLVMNSSNFSMSEKVFKLHFWKLFLLDIEF